MTALIEKTAQWLIQGQLTHSQLFCAFSGGKDSSALLFALHQLQAEMHFKLHAIHVNHQLMPNAAHWAKFCQQRCAELNIPIHIMAVDLNLQKGQSIEEQARLARYDAFASILNQDEVVLTAHHQADLVETFLLQLSRGSGISGLSAIAPIKACGQGRVGRPFLDVTTEEIQHCIQQHQVPHIVDDSNSDTRFLRNRLRQEFMPTLVGFQPGMLNSIARSIAHLQTSADLLNQYLEHDFKHCYDVLTGGLNLTELQTRSRALQYEIVRLWLKKQAIRAPSKLKLETIVHQLLSAPIDKQPSLHFGHHYIKRFAGQAYVIPESDFKALQNQDWHLKQPLTISPRLRYHAKRVRGRGISCHKIVGEQLMVKSRTGGEVCQMQHERIHRPLKKILQQLAVPSWQRQQIPLFYVSERLVAVGDLFICAGWAVQHEEESGWVIERENSALVV